MQRERGGRAMRGWVFMGLCAMLAEASGQGATRPAMGMAPPPPEPALVLIAAGQQPIRLAHAGVDVDVQGSLARTVIELTLANPNARTLEGELQFPLHAGQTVTGFALDMADGSMMPAVPVPKARGREVFEEVVRRGVDPALLEQTSGDNFRLRVYPLRPGASRRVRVELVEWLTPGQQSRLRLGLPLDFAGATADTLDLHVRLHATAAAGVRLGDGLEGASVAVHGADADLTLQRQGYRAAADGQRALDVSWPAAQGDTLLRERSDGDAFFHAELQVPDQPAPRARPDDVTLIWDASGSGAQRDHARERRLLAALFAWQPDVQVRLRVVRDAAEPDRLFDVRRGDWQALRAALGAIAYDGASNASLWTAPASRRPQASLALLFSDGLGNWGPQGAVAPGNVPAYAVQAAASGSAIALRQWAEARGGRLLDLAALEAADALRLIQQRGTHLVRIDGEGFAQAVVASGRPDTGRMVVAGRFTAATARLDLVLEAGDGRTLHKSVTLAAPPLAERGGGFAAQRWARLRVDELQAQAALHRTEIESLGKRFGIVTPATSLIVLETLADFQRYDLLPPAGPLREAFRAGVAAEAGAKAAQSERHLASLVERYRGVQAWWDKDFPKDAAPVVSKAAANLSGIVSGGAADDRAQRPAAAMQAAPMLRSLAPPPAPMAEAAAVAQGHAVQRVQSTGARASADAAKKIADGSADQPADIRIAVQAWSSDAPGAGRLAQAGDADRYAVYLDQRLAATGSPAFYLDAAQVFATHGQRGLALRVLSNLAELQIEDRALLRVLAYRLQEIGETAESIRLLQRVAELAPDEPQSWRDLGLAQAAAGAWQPAVDALWTAASGTWDARFRDIDVIALGELDAIAATHPGVDLAAVDARLRRNLPLDVRVALAWDTDNTDIDLWVKDPHGEWVSYQKPLSRQGGRVTSDVTNGYGPEVFALKKALPGRYEVHAKYYGSHRQALGNGTTVMMRLTTGFGTAAEQHRDVILRLEEARDDVLVGSFDVAGPK
ncbi:MAG: VIT domain-containing protein [Betaproteobacteria bacterium]